MSKPRIALALFFCLVSAGAIGALALADGESNAHQPRIPMPAWNSAVSGPTWAASAARFVVLARQTSNSCGLQPRTLEQMSSRMWLQGSCCSPMDLAAYRSQLRGLHAYSTISAIPPDPYDVSVALAKQLLAYDQAIRLNAFQAKTYARAMQLSSLKGPCCCRCWRWFAFRGLSKHLIADLRWGSQRIAALTALLEGCGGPLGSA